MASRGEIFSKHLPNVKLATRYDADGREVQVERREDVDATAKERETYDMLIAAGYYRAAIKGLSAFDKVVGGMTWCIECCDYDVDVDLLFHESLSIGQKIALVEKIVSVLPLMKCPYAIEPHQIQGLEFLAIHPVIQWLIKTSIENRTERGQRLKKFAIGQFHNHYQFKADKENLAKIRRASAHIKRIQELYSPEREYQRKEASSEDDRTRVLLTLLEYGYKGPSGSGRNSKDAKPLEYNYEQEFDIEQLLKNLSLAKKGPETSGQVRHLDDLQRKALNQHYKELKQEMEIDAKQLSEQSQLKMLEATQSALERKIQRQQTENEDLEADERRQKEALLALQAEKEELVQQIKKYEELEAQSEPAVLEKVKGLLALHDELKQQEAEFKEQCRQDLAQLQKEIDELKAFNSRKPEEQEAAVAAERKRMLELKLQLAKRNRGIVAIQRQLDAIPDRAELTQYQRRFLELYNEMSAKHLETKQYYTLFNTLNDQKRYMEKELSLLNSICEAYNEGMLTPHGREDFIAQFEAIVEGVKQAEQKVGRKFNEERTRRDVLNEDLQSLLELQRQYAAAVKQLTKECQRCEQLQHHLNNINRS